MAENALSLEFLPSGDTGLVVQFGERIDRAVSREVLRLGSALGAAGLRGVVESVPTFRSLLVHYDPLATSGAELTRAIEALAGGLPDSEEGARLWRLPICYAEAFAPDLAEVAERTGLTPREVVERHAAVRYHVYMMGFLPGFPYMGDLPQELVLPRRADPRVRVPPGSVGIATSLTSIYTLESPGGWHLIGATPARLFAAEWSPPALLAAGDAVVFEPVSAAEFETIRRDSLAGRYRVPCEEAPS